MTAGPNPINSAGRRRRIVVAGVVFAAALAALALWLAREDAPAMGATSGEKFVALRAERAAIQARANGEARIGLLAAFRVASLLTDALAARHEVDRERAFDRLPVASRQAFAELDALNEALKIAVERPGDGARLGAIRAADRAQLQLDRMAGLDGLPLVLTYMPGFVPPRHAAAELTLKPGTPVMPSPEGALHIEPRQGQPNGAAVAPTVPRYAPPFAGPGDDDPPVQVEIVGLNMASSGGSRPVLSIGDWRGEAVVSPQRLRFAVPRSAFATNATRTTFVSGSLVLRNGSRAAPFQLLFTVLPDRPGSFAFDQRIRTTTQESNTLVSPEILARAPAGETRTVRRCFDPPAGWRFDKTRRRVVVVERLGWLDDVADESMNGGTVEFTSDEGPEQICIAVVARPVSRAARTATIGRFEVTLVRDLPVDRAIRSGVRALDWQEPARMAIEPGMTEWKLYIRLFDEVDREFAGKADAGAIPAGLAFLRIAIDDDGKALVLKADPAASP